MSPTIQSGSRTFAKIFHGADVPMATVNSGAPDGFIGGFGVNGQFGVELLGMTGNDDDNDNPMAKELRLMHHKLADECEQKHRSQNIKQHWDAANNIPNMLEAVSAVHASMGGYKDDDNKELFNNTCSAYVEEIQEDSRPETKTTKASEAKNNRQMVYAVTPRGDDFKSHKEFLEAIKLTAYNIIIAVDYHNTRMKEKNKDYEETALVRIPAFGTGIAMHRDLQEENGALLVCEAIKFGIDDALLELGPKSAIRFIEYSPDMEVVFAKKKSNTTTSTSWFSSVNKNRW